MYQETNHYKLWITMWKEVIMANFKALFEKPEKPCQDRINCT